MGMIAERTLVDIDEIHLSDAETDYEVDDMITKWISKINFVGL